MPSTVTSTLSALLLAAAASLTATTPVQAKTFLLEKFEGDTLEKNWKQSSWKSASEMGKWDVSSGDWFGDEKAGRGLRTTEDARFYAISRKLDTTFSNEGKPLVVQYAVKNEKKGSSFCGGQYIKLLPANTDQSQFGGSSPYHIMFGPDICGYDVSRVHLIFNSQPDGTGENMLKKDDIKLEWGDKDEYTHLYTLVVNPDNTYEVFVDNKSRAKGELADGQWSKFPTKEIEDPTDSKPSDWVDEAKIADPSAKKPEDWDEEAPKSIADPAATKPADWDEAEDGAWEAPMVDNPKYKGKWTAPLIDNPNYKGVWAPRKIKNPEHVEGKQLATYKDIGVVGFELWVVNSGSIFSNIYVGDSVEEAKKLAEETYTPFVEAEKAAKKAFDEKNKPAEPAKAEGGDEADTEAKEEDEEEDKDEL